MGYDVTQTSDLLYPYRTTCAVCRGPLGYIVLDQRYCSYECAGVSVPDAHEHPASCWTTDHKPKMGFPTPDAAQRMCDYLRIPGVMSYYCTWHHFWHVGYSDGSTHDKETR